MPGVIDWTDAIAAYQQNQGVAQPALPAQAPAAPSPMVAPVSEAPPVQQPSAAPPAPPTIMPAMAPRNSREAAQEAYRAAGEQALAAQQGANARAFAGEESARELERQNAIESKAAADFQGTVDAAQKTSSDIQQQFQSLNDEANRAQVVDRRSTSQKSLGILAVALGGLGDALSAMGGRSTNFGQRVSDGIDQAVERDMQLQREAINGKRAAAASKLTELGLARRAFDDEKDAYQWAAAKRKEAYANQLAAIAQRSSVEAVRLEGMQAAAKIQGDAAAQMAQIQARREEAGMTAAAQRAQLEQRKQEFAIEAAQKQQAQDAEIQLKRDTLEGKGTAAPKLSEGQQKALALYTSSQADADRVAAALANGTPGALAARAAGSGYVPDAVLPAKWTEAYRSARAIVNDDLRDESGAAIGPHEKEELLAPLKSTDESIRRQGYERILAKRAAMGGKAGVQAPSTEQPASAPAGDRVMINPRTGERKRLPAAVAAEAAKRGWTEDG